MNTLNNTIVFLLNAVEQKILLSVMRCLTGIYPPPSPQNYLKQFIVCFLKTCNAPHFTNGYNRQTPLILHYWAKQPDVEKGIYLEQTYSRNKTDAFSVILSNPVNPVRIWPTRK